MQLLHLSAGSLQRTRTIAAVVVGILCASLPAAARPLIGFAITHQTLRHPARDGAHHKTRMWVFYALPVTVPHMLVLAGSPGALSTNLQAVREGCALPSWTHMVLQKRN